MSRKALVVVLGDLDRSPRMRYHCKSLASNNYHVSAIAYGGGIYGDKCCEELNSYDKNIKQYLIVDRINFKIYLPTILAYIIKTLWQSLLLIYQLFLISKPNVIIVQNPPSLPTLPILCLYSKLTGSKLIIDWHNYGYTILRLNFKNKPNHIMVRVYKFIEFYFGQFANAGFCVSQAMQKDLIENHHIRYPVYVLYDKPAEIFRPINWKEKHQFFLRMSKKIPEFGIPVTESDNNSLGNNKDLDWTQKIKNYRCSEVETRFTCLMKTSKNNKNIIVPKPDRPALIISSTSWTEDEDFGILFKALEGYDRFLKILHLNNAHKNINDDLDYKPPRIVCVITGKGPMKSYWSKQIKKCNFLFVEIILPWLESVEEYALMVAASDLGISLHQSSSNLDLPMKVVDMFGCGVPVLAYKYKTIGELVRSDLYGKLFLNHNQLEDLIKDLLLNLHESDDCSPGDAEQLDLNKFKKNIRRHFLIKGWNNNWIQVARPVFDNL